MGQYSSKGGDYVQHKSKFVGYVGIVILGLAFACLQWISMESYGRYQKNTQKNKMESSQAIECIQPGAQCVYVFEDTGKGTEQIKKRALASAFVGWKKEELVDYIKAYETEKRKKEKNLQSVELVQFSGNSITLKKKYGENTSARYRIAVEDNRVVVYDTQLGEKMEDTRISADQLSVDERKKLTQGIWVEDCASVYSILEDYSS